MKLNKIHVSNISKDEFDQLISVLVKKFPYFGKKRQLNHSHFKEFLNNIYDILYSYISIPVIEWYNG